MRVVVGTAGHIDHGKTALLQALTGIDADRLPEEQRRGMTIDVGYAHLDWHGPDESLDFVDVPGHDRLVGNMLVGAGEIDAALIVIAADDGPRPQTLEHIELLDALGIGHGVVAVTKADLVDASRLAEVLTVVRALVSATRFADAPVIAVSAVTGAGLDALRAALRTLVGQIDPHEGPTRLGVDRMFAMRGRGTVVTGSLRGGEVSRHGLLRVVPGDREVRVREVQVHGRAVEQASGGGRVALNLASTDVADLRRGAVLAAPGAVTATRRLLVALEPTCDLGHGVRRALPAHGERLRLHLGTDQVDVAVVRNARLSAGLPDGAATAVLRLERPVAATFGDRFVLRRPSPSMAAAGGRILDPLPPLGVSRRRATPASLAAVAAAGPTSSADALIALWGAVRADRVPRDTPTTARRLGPVLIDPEVAAGLETAATEAAAQSVTIADLRQSIVRTLRRAASVDADDAVRVADALIDDLVRRGTLTQADDRVGLPGRSEPLAPEIVEAMERVVAALSVAAPPPLSEVVRAAGCPPEGMRVLAASDRIVRLEADLAYARPTYARLVGLALKMAAAAPLTPAAFRDATGTSRRYALAILEDLGRRGLLARTADGHVPGPRAPAR